LLDASKHGLFDGLVMVWRVVELGDATSKVDVRGYSQLLADLSIVVATMAQNHLWTNLQPC
jgi:hypothetical protein